MKKHSDATNIYYSELLENKLFGVPFMYFQKHLFDNNMTNSIYLCSVNRSIQVRTVESISLKGASVVCKTIKLGLLLEKLKVNIILDVPDVKVTTLSKNDAYSLMWTLVFSSCVTKKTKNALKAILPTDFKVCLKNI